MPPVTSSRIDFSTAAAGFDQPLALWLACHERVHRMCSLLCRLREHIETSGADEAAGVSAQSILRYFDEAAPRHHEDEECDLFARLSALPGRQDGDTVARAIAQLQAEHAALEQRWHEIRPQLQAVVRGEAPRLSAQDVQAFDLAYRQHIALEETVLLPAMQSGFDERVWPEIGRAMAARRGVDWDSLQK
jgi:pyridoxamine 5'-phosphate oxidase